MSEVVKVSSQQTLTIQQAIDNGIRHHKAGHLSEAENIYKQLLQADPSQPVALHLLGLAAHQTGKNEIAIALITKALAIKPEYAAAHNNLGSVFKELGRLDEAVASYNKALAIKPDYAVAKYNLRSVLKRLDVLEKDRLLFNGLSTNEVFTKIYNEGLWGKSSDQAQPFFSGTGSHNPLIVNAYLTPVKNFLSSFKEKLSVVDLGCGDFYVGSKLRDLCSDYIACDIVEPLINFNKEKYKALKIDFRVLDLTTDELPPADVVFIRQVFMHLTNKQIADALPEICSKYKYLFLTESLSSRANYTANVDIPVGRLARGIVLTEPPFNLQPIKENLICETAQSNSIVRTTFYQLSR